MKDKQPINIKELLQEQYLMYDQFGLVDLETKESLYELISEEDTKGLVNKIIKDFSNINLTFGVYINENSVARNRKILDNPSVLDNIVYIIVNTEEKNKHIEDLDDDIYIVNFSLFSKKLQETALISEGIPSNFDELKNQILIGQPIYSKISNSRIISKINHKSKKKILNKCANF